jgi:large subunit ribosomal protein L4
MPDIAVKDIKNRDAGTLTLKDELFGITGKEALMHGAVVNYLANQRQGAHSTKTRGLVRGGGRKPYKQKGTGRARAGSNRSPLWRGGGTTFGPRPRDYSYKMPRRARKLALYAALSGKLADGEVVVVDGLTMDEPRTKKMVEVLRGLELEGKSLLVVLKEMDANVALASRNIPAVSLKMAGDLHAYDVLSRDRLLVSRDALEALEEGGAEK